MKLCLFLLLPMAIVLTGCEKSRPVATSSPTPASSEVAPPPPADAPAGAAPAPSAGPRGAGGPRPGGGGGGDRGAQRFAEMQSSLGLTPEQVEKVKAVMESQRPAMEVIRSDTSLSREQRREKMRTIRQSADSQLATILTPEQKAKWDQERAQRQKQREGGNNPPGGGGGTNP